MVVVLFAATSRSLDFTMPHRCRNTSGSPLIFFPYFPEEYIAKLHYGALRSITPNAETSRFAPCAIIDTCRRQRCPLSFGLVLSRNAFADSRRPVAPSPVVDARVLLTLAPVLNLSMTPLSDAGCQRGGDKSPGHMISPDKLENYPAQYAFTSKMVHGHQYL